jgi:hypothetical protein
MDAQPRTGAAPGENASAGSAKRVDGTHSDGSSITEKRPAPVPTAASTSTKTGKQDDVNKGSPMRANLRNLSG